MLEIQRPPSGETHLFIIGPDRLGNSALGQRLAPELGRTRVDLDDIFTRRIGSISAYIRDKGLAAYYQASSALTHKLVAEITAPSLLVTSSDFLSANNPAPIYQANHDLILSGYSIALLPARMPPEAKPVTAKCPPGEELAPGRESQVRKLRERFALFQTRADMLVWAVQIDADLIASLRVPLASMVALEA